MRGILVFTILSLVILSAPSKAADNMQSFSPNTSIGDGKDGRVFKNWEQKLDQTQIDRITLRLTKLKGGNDAYVNLRFGDGPTLENGKREYVTHSNPHLATWKLDGARSNGKPLTVKAYNGEFLLSAVEVYFRSIPVPLPSRPQTRANEFSQGSDPEAVERCRRMRNIKDPSVEIGRVRGSGGLFSGKYKIEGSVRGVCIAEAGYFENGRLKEKIEFPLDDKFQRREFKLKVRSGQNGKIRATTYDGNEEEVDVDRVIVSETSLF